MSESHLCNKDNFISYVLINDRKSYRFQFRLKNHLFDKPRPPYC